MGRIGPALHRGEKLMLETVITHDIGSVLRDEGVDDVREHFQSGVLEPPAGKLEWRRMFRQNAVARQEGATLGNGREH